MITKLSLWFFVIFVAQLFVSFVVQDRRNQGFSAVFPHLTL